MFSQLKPFRKVKRKINGKIKKTIALLLILPMIWAMLPVEAQAFATKGPEVKPQVEVTYALSDIGDNYFGTISVPYGTIYGSPAAPVYPTGLNLNDPNQFKKGDALSGYQIYFYGYGEALGLLPSQTPLTRKIFLKPFWGGYESIFNEENLGLVGANLTYYDIQIYDSTDSIKLGHGQFHLIDSLSYAALSGYSITADQTKGKMVERFREAITPWVLTKLYDTTLWEAASTNLLNDPMHSQNFYDGKDFLRSQNGTGKEDIGEKYAVVDRSNGGTLIREGASYRSDKNQPPYDPAQVVKTLYPQVDPNTIQMTTDINQPLITKGFIASPYETLTAPQGHAIYKYYLQFADYKINLKALHLRAKVKSGTELDFVSAFDTNYSYDNKPPLEIYADESSVSAKTLPYSEQLSLTEKQSPFYKPTEYFHQEDAYIQKIKIPIHDFTLAVPFPEGMNKNNLELDWRIGTYMSYAPGGQLTKFFKADTQGIATQYTVKAGKDGKERAYFKMPVKAFHDYYKAINSEKVYGQVGEFFLKVREGTGTQPVVTGVTIEPALANVTTGSTLQLSATVQGTNLSEADKQVSWSIDEVTAGLTTESSITVNGLLSVGAAEKQTALTVKATSKKEPSNYAAAKIRINSSEPIPQEYPITVMNGTADKGKAAEGTTVTLTAADLTGKTFTHWTAVPAVTLADAQRPTTTFMMPNEAVSLTANYKDNSSGGGGSGGGGSGGGGSSGGSSGGGGSSNPASTTPAPPVNPVPAADTKQPSLPAMTFNDVAPTNWYHDAVAYVLSNNLMKGTSETTFQPMENATRGMIATILYNMAGAPAQAEQSSFNDIAAGKWYTPSVTWAEKQGLVGGFPDNTFRPADKINREQLIFILYQYALKNGKVNTTSRGNPDLFADGAKISPWAKQAMIWALGEGLLTGKGNNILDPKGDLTRAELAALLMKFHPMFQ